MKMKRIKAFVGTVSSFILLVFSNTAFSDYREPASEYGSSPVAFVWLMIGTTILIIYESFKKSTTLGVTACAGITILAVLCEEFQEVRAVVVSVLAIWFMVAIILHVKDQL